MRRTIGPIGVSLIAALGIGGCQDAAEPEPHQVEVALATLPGVATASAPFTPPGWGSSGQVTVTLTLRDEATPAEVADLLAALPTALDAEGADRYTRLTLEPHGGGSGVFRTTLDQGRVAAPEVGHWWAEQVLAAEPLTVTVNTTVGGAGMIETWDRPVAEVAREMLQESLWQDREPQWRFNDGWDIFTSQGGLTAESIDLWDGLEQAQDSLLPPASVAAMQLQVAPGKEPTVRWEVSGWQDVPAGELPVSSAGESLWPGVSAIEDLAGTEVGIGFSRTLPDGSGELLFTRDSSQARAPQPQWQTAFEERF